MCYNFACRLRHLLEVHVLIMEYPGYGICPGKPSEDSFRQASQICLNFVTKVLRIPSSDIIIVGRSLGAAVALQVAATSAACGLVLIAPFLSLQDAVGQFVGQEASKVLVKNMFCNSEVIKTVKEVPVLVIHGDRDMLVDCSQGRQLLELCPSETKRFVSPPGMGHNDDLLANVDLLWRFLDCRSTLLAFLPDPLDWRALQCACRWRTGLEDLLAKVHLDPRLRSAVRRCICTLRRLPRDDLLGDRVQSAELSVESERFFVTLLGARPKGVQGKALDLSFWHSQLIPKQGRSLGVWLQSSKLEHLSLADCDGLLQGDGLHNVLCGLGSAQLQLRHLNLCAAELSPANSSALVDIMTRCPLQTLNLAFNIRLMTPAGLEGLVRAAVKKVFALQRLVLKHCDIAAKVAAKLACWLSHMPDLQELILDWNVAMYTSLGLRGLVQGMSCMGPAEASGAFSTLGMLQLTGCQLGSGAEEALRDFLRRCPALRQLEVSQCRTSQRIWAELGHCGEKGPQSCGKKPGFLQAMRQSAVRDCLRCLLPGPLDWRAMQIACRWGDGISNGPLSEVHRRPRLRSAAVQMARRLRGLGDLLGAAALKHSAEELRFAVEILGARPRQAPRVRLPEIQALDLSHEHLLTGGQMLAPLQGRALGIFLRHCPQLQELCLLGHAQLCTAAGLEGLMKGLAEVRLPLRSLHFGGCGVTEHVAPHLGRFLRQCPELASLSLAGSWQLCTATGLRVLTEIWGMEGGSLRLEELNLTNCRLGAASAEALGELLRKCCFLTKLVLSGNQDLFDASAIAYLLKGLADGGFPRLREITTGPQLLEEEAFRKEFSFFLRRCSLLRARSKKDAFDKRLCPLYHGVVEMTKHDRPLPASTGDEAQEVWGSDVPRPAEGLSPCRGPKVCDDRCKHVVGDLQPPEADCDELLRHSQEDSAGAEPDLNVGITRYLAFADSSGFSAKVASTSGSGGSSQVPTVPMGSGREISEMSCSKPVAAG
ncbi:abhd13 [Symbiodinium microadriaticum]|nr:abhd13 [Symbiodinium microadriaticum]